MSFCALILKEANAAEKAEYATFMSLTGIGVSLVNGPPTGSSFCHLKQCTCYMGGGSEK